MPIVNGNTQSWTGHGLRDADGNIVMEGNIYCARERCHVAALLGETTRYSKIGDDMDIWRLPPSEREAAARAQQAERAERMAAYKAAPLPEGWWVTEGSSGYRRAYCSPRCARLDLKDFETGKR